MALEKYPTTVFILGAGSSLSSGPPLMNDFLDRAEDYYREGEVTDEYTEHFKRVFDALDQMQPMHSKANINLDNIEDVFGAFEIAKIVKRLGTFKEEEIEQLSRSTKIVIAHTLELSTVFSIDDQNIKPNDDYLKFRNHLTAGSPPSALKNYVFITFNYDVCLDWYLHGHGHEIDYGLNAEAVSSNRTIGLYKLHGSINWSVCPECNTMFTVPWKNFLKFFKERIEPKQQTGTSLQFITWYHEFAPCKRCRVSGNRFEPAIVPPTWSKTTFHSQISHVWHCAANALANAEHIYVIGYSLPVTDMFFRLLFAIGSVSKRRLRRFWVFNPDVGAKPRFDEIIGKSRAHRYEFIKATFAEGIEHKLFVEPKKVYDLGKDSTGARIIGDSRGFDNR